MARARSPSQAAMEWGPLVRIYESRLWRRSALLAAFTRISFEREYELVRGALAGCRRLLDLGCGPGIYGRALARDLGGVTVTGLDLSWPMLRQAAQRAGAAHPGSFRLVRGDALALPFAAERFDGAVCCGALHLFPDSAGALRELARVLAPGGRLAVAVVLREEGLLGDAIAALRRRWLGVRAYTPRELEALFAEAGLRETRVLHAAGLWLIASATKA